MEAIAVYMIRPKGYDDGWWCYCDCSSDAIDLIDDDEEGRVFEIKRATMSAKERQALPDFRGW